MKKYGNGSKKIINDLSIIMKNIAPPIGLYWTIHAQSKMRFYNLSQSRVKRVINHPKRTEKGIAPKTIAFMQPAGNQKRIYEIWVMIQDAKKDGAIIRRVISAWRYPGQTKPNQPLPIEIIREIEEAALSKD